MIETKIEKEMSAESMVKCFSEWQKALQQVMPSHKLIDVIFNDENLEWILTLKNKSFVTVEN